MRSFIAIEVPFTKEMESLQNSIDGRVKLVERENVHITLKFLGEIDEKTFEMVRQIVEDCKVGSFKITLRGVGFFPNERYVRVVWIGVDNYEPIERMARCIDEKLRKIGFQREKSYVPHLTVARAKGRITIRNLEKFKNMRFAEMEVKEIKIKKSTLTPNGPVYEDLATIQL
ncbi:2'-5' RNA ligase [Aciduliprofundum sp. MAR08-339]|uniref:RNA 2',3'-cyclic phosphodiesterase n=1 Tax=Aciduliprofundum sp. (strain MAR08-339) TaxID=673860 RepID=UPI0002A4C3C1|nr:2'-5' RNA ligase [Aciduliprofundum sp. MAR08-339]